MVLVVGVVSLAACYEPDSLDKTPDRCSVATESDYELELATCVAAIDDGSSGQACCSFCSAFDGCCESSLSCSEGVLMPSDSSHSGWQCSMAQVTNCEASAPNASISGTTPLGVIDLPFAWSGFDVGFMVGMRLFFIDASPAITCGPLSMAAFIFGLARNETVGSYQVPIGLSLNGEHAAAVADIEITDAGPDGLTPSGTLFISGDGWDLSGTFTAPDCEAFNRSFGP